MQKHYLVTGAAGFIGSHVAKRLIDEGHRVIGIDNLNDYYDPRLKRARLSELLPGDGFTFKQIDIADRSAMADLFSSGGFDRVIHMAAQAGVRHSIHHPFSYADSNLIGFLTVLEGCRHHAIEHLVYASSSSVYGANETLPFCETDRTDHPVSLYGATKKANEVMAYSYAHLYGLAATGLRFFTVYGPWGRPDMAYYEFTRRILAGEPIDVFNEGRHGRDFTYIDDIVEGVVRTAADAPFEPVGEGAARAPHRLFNIGNSDPVELMDFIAAIERAVGKPAVKNFLPMQSGDVHRTFADIDALQHAVGFKPSTALSAGIERFVAWFRAYRGL